MVCIHIYYYYTEETPSLGLQAGFTPQKQLLNFISVFGTADLVCFADSLPQTSLAWLYDNVPESQVVQTALNSSLKAFKLMLQSITNDSAGQEGCLVYFIDGHIIHSPMSPACIQEGLQLADYVTLIDSPDKYVNSGSVLKETVGGSLIWGNGEWTRLVYTPSTHWKSTYSTGISVAGKASTLAEDAPIFNAIDDFDRYPLLQNLWLSLRKAGRTLISSVPGKATMSYAAYVSPIVDWNAILLANS